MGLTPLKEHFQGPLNMNQLKWKVLDLINSSRKWNHETLSEIFPKETLHTINVIYINVDNEGKDELIWAWSKDGNFDTTITYAFIGKYFSEDISILQMIVAGFGNFLYL